MLTIYKHNHLFTERVSQLMEHNLNKRPRGRDDLLDLLPDETNIALWIVAK